MKRLTQIITLALLLLMAGLPNATAQNQQQHDIMDCLRNYSLYREYYKQKNYSDALPYWRLVYYGSCTKTLMAQGSKYAKVPKVVMQNGASIYKHFVTDALNNKETDKANAYLDTVMMIYQKRMEIYPQDSARVLGYMGIDLLKYKKGSPGAMKKAYDYLGQAINLSGNKTKAPILAAYMDLTISLFKDRIITNEEVVNNYSKLSQIIDAKLNETPDNEEVLNLKDHIANQFTSSGAATCESLIALFSPNFDKNKDNPEAMKKYVFWLKNTGCEETELYLKSMIALNKIDPSSAVSYDIARIYKNRGDYDKAIDYLKQAVSLETDGTVKSKFYVEIADIIFRIKKDLPLAKSYCVKAMQADPKSGLPHMLLGRIYANAKNYGDDDLAHAAVFWAAVDQFNIAKKKDPSLAQMANEYIATYSKHFPSQETVFFYTFKQGDKYELKGWINETTTVRIRK